MIKRIPEIDTEGGYNGWANWDTWNAYNWLSGYEDEYRDAVRLAKKSDAVSRVKDYFTRLMEIGVVKDDIDVEKVNWEEIIDNLLEE